jgi:uncharacterized membrane protein
MPTPKPFAGRRHEVSRLEGFSDAVFAFAVTLLVVSLEVPQTFNELWAAMREFPAFAACFALLFQLWWRHFNFFRRYGLEDRTTITLTALLLFVVLFYVYPLKFVFRLMVLQWLHVPTVVHGPEGHAEPMITGEQTPLMMQIYSGGVIAVYSLFALLYRHAWRKRTDLGLDPHEALDTRLAIVDNAGIAAIGLLSFTIASIGSPAAAALIGGPIYFLIGPFKWALAEYRSRAAQRLLAPVD